MQQYPKLEVVAYEFASDGSCREIGTQDLTASAIRAMVAPGNLRGWLGRDRLPMDEIIPSLTEEARRAAASGDLYIPELAHRFRDFAAEVREVGGPMALRDHLRSIELCRKSVSDAAELLKCVYAARVSDPGGFSHYADPLTGEIKAKPDDGYGWGRIAHSLIEGPKRTFSNRRKGWEERERQIGEWDSQSTPPFAFGTLKAPWRGIVPLRYAEFVNRGGVDLLSFVNGDQTRGLLVGSLVDVWLLDEAAADFLERGPSRETRQAFADAVRAWNRRQTAEFVIPDRTRVVPAMAGVSHADMAGWCRRHLHSTIEVYGGMHLERDAPGAAARMH